MRRDPDLLENIFWLTFLCGAIWLCFHISDFEQEWSKGYESGFSEEEIKSDYPHDP